MSLTFSLGRKRLTCLACSARPYQIRTLASVPEKRKPTDEEGHTLAPNIYSKAASTKPTARSPSAPSSFASSAKPVRDPSLYKTNIDAPRSYGPVYASFEPKLLPRPIGMLDPPLPGQNTGETDRTKIRNVNELADYDKHLERRRALYGTDPSAICRRALVT